MNEAFETMLCGVCGCIHPVDQYEHVGGGARPDFSSGDLLEFNWIDLRCLVTGEIFQVSWFDELEEESEEP
jgi:hypothetical protein